MSDDTKDSDPKTCVWKQETADYYFAEWNNERSFGWLVRNLSERTGLSITDALLFLNWMERFTSNNLKREYNRIATETIEMQRKVLGHAVKEIDEEEKGGWKP